MSPIVDRQEAYQSKLQKSERKKISSSSSVRSMLGLAGLSEPCSPKQQTKRKKTLKQNYLTNAGTDKIPFSSFNASHSNLEYYCIDSKAQGKKQIVGQKS